MTVIQTINKDDYYDEQYASDAEDMDIFCDKPNLVQRTPWWIISIVFHAAFLIMAAMWVISSSSTEEEFSIFEMNVKKFKQHE